MGKNKITLSVMIPAYNEEKNLEKSVESVLKAVKMKNIKDYEILIFNDCSTDKTGIIADKLASLHKKIKTIHNKINMGLGYNYIEGSRLASMEYYTFFPGDNENAVEGFQEAIRNIGEADIIAPYTINQEVRPLSRRIISSIFTKLLNLLFNLNLRYYNGPAIYKTEVLKKVNITTFGFAYSAEILVKLIKKGYSYKEIGVRINPVTKTSAFRLKNIIGVIKLIIRLFYEVNIKRKY